MLVFSRILCVTCILGNTGSYTVISRKALVGWRPGSLPLPQMGNSNSLLVVGWNSDSIFIYLCAQMPACVFKYSLESPVNIKEESY